MLSQLLESVAKESEISVVRVLDKNGRVIASSRQDEPAQRERMTVEGGPRDAGRSAASSWWRRA